MVLINIRQNQPVFPVLERKPGFWKHAETVVISRDRRPPQHILARPPRVG
jgi:hypothetical protein